MRHSSWWVSATCFAAVYLAAVGSFYLWDVAMAGVVGMAAVAVYQRRGAAATRWSLRRSLAALRLLAAVLVSLVRGSGRTFYLFLRRRPASAAGVIGVPRGERTASGVAFSTLVATMSPGSLALIGAEAAAEGDLLVHFLDASDPSASRRAVSELYQNYQRHVVP